MKRIGIIFLGVGFGILCYIIFSLFFRSSVIVSPVEEIDANKVIQQNIKK
jgi:hypothetical protein